MTIIFTLCSANYLAHAKSLGESVKEQNPDCHFVIGLVDRVPQALSTDYWRGFELIPVEELHILDFAAMMKRYNIVELNTAVKPFYMTYLYGRYSQVRNVIYMDPDILVLSSLNPLIESLRTHSLVLTPHSYSFEASNTYLFYEHAMLTTGIYNLGFLGSSRSPETLEFLRWWEVRLRDMCYYRPGRGLFVDQLWAMFAPLYCPSALIDKNPGYNMSYWNLFERSLSCPNGSYLVNGKYPLMFYHFSSFNPDSNDVIASRQDVPIPSLSERTDIKPLIEEYRKRLFRNQYSLIKNLPWFYKKVGEQNQGRFQNSKKLIRSVVQKGFGIMPHAVRIKIAKLAGMIASSCSE